MSTHTHTPSYSYSKFNVLYYLLSYISFFYTFKSTFCLEKVKINLLKVIMWSKCFNMCMTKCVCVWLLILSKSSFNFPQHRFKLTFPNLNQDQPSLSIQIFFHHHSSSVWLQSVFPFFANFYNHLSLVSVFCKKNSLEEKKKETCLYSLNSKLLDFRFCLSMNVKRVCRREEEEERG